MGNQVVWFKRDLRTTDHRPLSNAATRGPCICLYIYEPEVYEAPDFDSSHLAFINESLAELRTRLRELGCDLILRRGEATEVLDQLLAQVGFNALWSHEETGNAVTYARDQRLADWCRQNQIEWNETPQNGVVRKLKHRDGWARSWQQRMREPITPEPASIKGVSLEDCGSIQSACDLKLPESERTDVQAGGRREAMRSLTSFLEERGENYRSDMSSPTLGETGCSRLSPYLAWGNLSMRETAQATSQRIEHLRELRKQDSSAGGNWLKSLSSFQSRLSWHCHFMQKLEDEPAIEFENVNRGYDGLREDEFDPSRFDAWCHGQTGYPMVDACMRALHQTGWINFRMRAMLVSFASYHLWLHWRETSVYASRLFLDYEPGIHYSQFQMQSGVTGINTVRIYSPIKQVADNDPKGEFIRRFVPELEGVPDHLIAEPHRMTGMEQILYGCQIGNDYPPPIVDHKEAYRAAKERIFEAKGRPETRELAKQVYLKHGSRKTPMKERR
ncbi:MAG: deoxyribodipyrimidine photo-lyase [Planctomycetota bacterium]